jgi:hypothetical protein
MKLLILLIPFSLFGYSLPDGAKGISPIRDVGIVKLKPNSKCERGICTELELEFTLYGCMDELGPVYFKVKQVDDRFIFFLNPLNIHMKQSETVMCLLPKKVRRSFELSNLINLDNLFFSFLEE